MVNIKGVPMATQTKSIILSRSKPVKGTCKITGEIKVYQKLSDVKEDGFDVGKVSMCCSGKRGSHKDYLWEYLPTASKREQLLNQDLYTSELIFLSEDLLLGTFKCGCGSTYVSSIEMARQGFKSTCEECKVSSYKKYKEKYPHLVRVYSNMKTRCSNPNTEAYKEYGEKGITVCQEWVDSFQTFLDWSMSNGYSEELSLDRIKLDLGYSPDNCRWTTKYIQSQNTRKLMSTNKSGYRGVSVHTSGKWQAEIKHNGKRSYLGLFNSALEAAIAYDTYVLQNSTEHTRNFIGPETKLQELLDRRNA